MQGYRDATENLSKHREIGAILFILFVIIFLLLVAVIVRPTRRRRHVSDCESARSL
jgi:hypothetical protein